MRFLISLQHVESCPDSQSLENYTDVNNGYDEMFGYYVTYMKKLVPQVLSNNFMFNLSTTGKYANVPDPGYGMDSKLIGSFC